MKDKSCPRCHRIMIIDEWTGWIWFCPNCGMEGETATAEEIGKWERDNSTDGKERKE